MQARFHRGQVAIEGNSTAFQRTGDSGGTATFHFCPSCGSTVYWFVDGLPDDVAVAVGAFTDASFPPPEISVYSARRHPWTAMPDLHLAEDWG